MQIGRLQKVAIRPGILVSAHEDGPYVVEANALFSQVLKVLENATGFMVVEHGFRVVALVERRVRNLDCFGHFVEVETQLVQFS